MKNTAYLVAIGALVIAVSILGYKLSQSSDTVHIQEQEIGELDLERNNLIQELEIMALRYDTMETDNMVLRAELAGQQDMVADLQSKLKNNRYSLNKARKEAETLRSIMKGYVHDIDSLNQIAIALRAERDQIAAERDVAVSNYNNAQQDLQTSEEIIRQGQVLQTAGISCQGIKLSRSGAQRETDRASKTELIKSCFTIIANPIAAIGDKELFMQIIGPGNQVMPTKSGVATTTLGGETQPYSVVRNINYQREEMDVCFFYNVAEGEELPKGDYVVKIYEAGALIGTSSVSLK